MTGPASRPPDWVVGVDVGGTKLLAGAVDPRGRVGPRAHRWVSRLTAEQLLDTIEDAVREVVEATGGASAAGFGIPCTFDRPRGTAVSAVHQPLTDVPFAAIMAERLGIPVSADNDGNCATLIEARWGAARGARHAVLLTLGTGIAGGLVLDGRLYRGAIGSAGELGHMVIDADGPPCLGGCPNRGCLESLASGTALVLEAGRRVAERPDTGLGRALANGVPLDGPLVSAQALAGDPVARGAVEEIGRRLGVGLTNVVNIFNPEVVVIGGGAMAAGEILLAPAREVMRARALPPARDGVRVVATAFGEEAGMLGAAVLAREEALGEALGELVGA